MLGIFLGCVVVVTAHFLGQAADRASRPPPYSVVFILGAIMGICAAIVMAVVLK